MDKKYGVYICEGCGIGESLDVKALQDVVAEEGLAAKTQPILCSKEGVDFLKQDSEDSEIRPIILESKLKMIAY